MLISNSLKDELKNILIHLIRIPSENPPGKTEQIVDYLRSKIFYEKEGFTIEVITHKKNNIMLHNIITRIGTGNNKIILSGHLDVVPIGDISNWNYPPFSAKLFNGRLYGRGSADMKGGLTSLIGVLKTLAKNTSFLKKYELIFLGTADEEAGMSGSLTLQKIGIIDGADLLIIGEPTNLNVGIAEKGLLWTTLKIYGKSAHGSTPEQGVNAIEGSLNILPQLHTCLDNKKNPILGYSTLNVGKIRGGTKINIVPDYVELEVDFRLIPEQNHLSVINKLTEINLETCKIDVKITNNLPALETDPNHPFIKNLQKISQSERIGLSYATDAAKLIITENPIPFMIYGPGNPNDVHKINESISFDQVYKATENLSVALLKTYLT
ncbi:MAG: M20 family metallopeptidase [Candidatus Thorarchaeota archaeon]